MQLVWWFIGIMVTWTVFKFVLRVFKRLGSKENMDDMLDKAENWMNRKADDVAGYLKKKKRMRKKKQQQPVVTIR